MENKIKGTALLVFSLSAKKEAERKAIFGNKGKSVTREFFDILIRQTSDIAVSSGVDVLWVDEKKQRGSNFGERYANAFQEVFAQGYENVVSIGNDCPNLTTEILKSAIDQVQRQKVVLGPSQDGGIYLLGIQKKAFNPHAFAALPWLQETLFTAILDITEAEEVFLLPTLCDLDCQKDVLQFALSNVQTALSDFIFNHLSHKPIIRDSFSQGLIFSFFNRELLLRGPPVN